MLEELTTTLQQLIVTGTIVAIGYMIVWSIIEILKKIWSIRHGDLRIEYKTLDLLQVKSVIKDILKEEQKITQDGLVDIDMQEVIEKYEKKEGHTRGFFRLLAENFSEDQLHSCIMCMHEKGKECKINCPFAKISLHLHRSDNSVFANIWCCKFYPPISFWTRELEETQ